MKLFQCAVRRQSERDGRVLSEGLFLAVWSRIRRQFARVRDWVGALRIRRT